METVGDWSVEFGMGFQFVCLCKYPHVFFSATGTLVHSGPRKQHKQNNSNSNNNNKMNSIHISMEQHCPGGLTLAGQPSHVRSGPSGWTQKNNTMRRVFITQRDREFSVPVHTFLLKAFSVDQGKVIIVNLN